MTDELLHECLQCSRSPEAIAPAEHALNVEWLQDTCARTMVKPPGSCELNYQVGSYFSLHMSGKPMMKNEYMKFHKQTPLFTRRWQAHYVTWLTDQYHTRQV